MLITGAAGDVGSRLAAALGKDYRVVGMDRPGLLGLHPLASGRCA
jgi:nucleoside-diphosphate-sugar epimerase